MLCAGMLWIADQREASKGAEAAKTIAGSVPPSATSSAAADATKPKPTPSKKPKPEKPLAILDTFTLVDQGCREEDDGFEDRSIAVNVIERRGEVDKVTLVWKSKDLDWERSLRLYPDGKQWTGTLQSLPYDVDLHLNAILEGPGGTTTLGKSIARYC